MAAQQLDAYASYLRRVRGTQLTAVQADSLVAIATTVRAGLR